MKKTLIKTLAAFLSIMMMSVPLAGLADSFTITSEMLEDDYEIPQELQESMSPEEIEQLLKEIEKAREAEKARIAAELAEQERLEQEALEAELEEQERLEQEALEEQERLEQEALEAELAELEQEEEEYDDVVEEEDAYEDFEEDEDAYDDVDEEYEDDEDAYDDVDEEYEDDEDAYDDVDEEYEDDEYAYDDVDEEYEDGESEEELFFDDEVVEEPAEEIEEPAEEIEEPVEEIAEPVRAAEAHAEDEAEVVEIDEYDTAMGVNDFQNIVVSGDVEINVREDADGLSAIFVSLTEGAELTVIAIEGDWVKVLVGEQIGYIYIDDIVDELELPEESETVAEAKAEAVEKKVTIFSSRRSVMKRGETVELTSKLEGFEDCEAISYQWECDKGDGFAPVNGATGDTYAFSADSESLSWDWRLIVSYC